MNDFTGGFSFLPPDISTHGDRIDSLIYWTHILMYPLFIGWGLFFLYTLVRFRARRNRRADYEGVKSHKNTYLEVFVAVIEAVLLFALSIPLWADRVAAVPADEDAVVIRVHAEQFQWNIHYPGPDGKFGPTSLKYYIRGENPIGLNWDGDGAADDVVKLSQLVIPKDRPIKIELYSLDVIHSFYLPELRVKHDVIPGMMIPLWFEAVATSDEFKQWRFRDAEEKGYVLTMEVSEDVEVAVTDENGQITMETQPVVTKVPVTKWEEVRDLEIACAQLCGVGHRGMRGFLTILTYDEWLVWLKGNAG